MTQATQSAVYSGVNLHDVSTSAHTPVSVCQGREDYLGPHSLHLCSQDTDVLLDLVQALLYCMYIVMYIQAHNMLSGF